MKTNEKHITQINDQKSFKDKFTYFYPKLMALACRFVDRDTAEDIVQDLFVSYFEQQNELRPDSLHSYFFKSIQNRCLNYLRHQMVVEDYNERIRIAESRIAHLSERNQVWNDMVNSDLKEHIEASVSKLPTKAQEVFRLYFFEDQPQKEIAEKLGISARTVASHVYSSVQFLREDLKDLLILYLAFLKVLN